MGQLYCGAAKECITPGTELLSNLVGLKQHRFAGVIDDIYVRVIAIGTKEHKALIISFDLTTAPCSEEILQRLSAATGAAVEDILFFSIHTHAVPFNDIDLEERQEQSEMTLAACRAYTEFLHERVLAAAKEAVLCMRPARMGYVRGESHINVVRLQDYYVKPGAGTAAGAEGCCSSSESGPSGDVPGPSSESDVPQDSRESSPRKINGADDSRDLQDASLSGTVSSGRRVICGLGADPTAYADPTLFALRIDDAAGGAPIAFFVNYAVHNVTTIWNDYDGNGAMGISGDIAGRVSCLLEEEFEGSVALWSSAAAGDLNPLMLNEVVVPDLHTGAPTELHPDGTGYALWCREVMARRHYADVLRTVESISCRETDGTVEGLVEWSVTPGVECIRHPGAAPEFVTGEDVPDHTVRLQMVRIGSLVLIGAGAELYSSIGRAMLAQAPEDAVLITHNASALCSSHYILDDETMERCRRSGEYAMIPGYDEYRCQEGVMKADLSSHIAHMSGQLKWGEA